jgi:hypothetical protein
MKKNFIFLLLLFVNSNSFAHETDIRQDIKMQIEIEAPASKVWSIVKNFRDLNWNNNVINESNESNENRNNNKIGSTRMLRLDIPHVILTEELKRYDNKEMSYKYKINEIKEIDKEKPELPLSYFTAHLYINKKEGNRSIVTWEASYYISRIPDIEDDKSYTNSYFAKTNNMVKSLIQSGLKSLKEEVER